MSLTTDELLEEVRDQCPNHKPIQHRDGKPPWCRTCGLTAEGHEPVSRLQKEAGR